MKKTKEDIPAMLELICKNMGNMEAIMYRLEPSRVLFPISKALKLWHDDPRLIERIQHLTIMGVTAAIMLEQVTDAALALGEEVNELTEMRNDEDN